MSHWGIDWVKVSALFQLLGPCAAKNADLDLRTGTSSILELQGNAQSAVFASEQCFIFPWAWGMAGWLITLAVSALQRLLPSMHERK